MTRYKVVYLASDVPTALGSSPAQVTSSNTTFTADFLSPHYSVNKIRPGFKLSAVLKINNNPVSGRKCFQNIGDSGEGGCHCISGLSPRIYIYVVTVA